jgi:hypothetical protein
LAVDQDIPPVFCDPDRGVMVYMSVYQKKLNDAQNIAKKGVTKNRKDAYEDCRALSNAIVNRILNEAVVKRRSIAHGTTLTTTHLLPSIQQYGYKIHLLVCGASNETRSALSEARENVEGYYQATQQDIIDKGKKFPSCHQEYFKYADILDIYYTTSSSSSSLANPIANTLAATYEDKKQTPVVHDKEIFVAYKNLYHAAQNIAENNQKEPILLWENLEKIFSTQGELLAPVL